MWLVWFLGGVLIFCCVLGWTERLPPVVPDTTELERAAARNRLLLDERDAYADDMDLAELRFYAHREPPPAVQPWWVPFSES